MKFGVTFVPTDLTAYQAWVGAAENAGFDFIGVPDTQASLYRECYVTLTLAATHTKRVLTGPLVTNPLTRHPAVTAAAISSADEVSGGRTVLCISSGDSAVFNLGMRPGRLAALEEYVVALRGLFTGKPIMYQGHEIQLRWARRQIPIYIAGEGPLSLRLAGRIADGVVVGMGVLPEVVETALAHVRAGAEEAGRRLEDLDIWFLARCGIADDRESAVRFLRPSLAAAANHAFRFSDKGKCVPPHLSEPLRKLREGYNVRYHSDTIEGNPNVRLVEDLGLTQYLSERMAVVGTEAQCIQQIRTMRSAGITGLIVRPLVPDTLDFIRRWQRVMDAVKAT